MYVMPEAYAIGFLPHRLICHELIIGELGGTMLPRYRIRIFLAVGLMLLKAIVDYRFHYGRQMIRLVFIFQLYDDCQSLPPLFANSVCMT